MQSFDGMELEAERIYVVHDSKSGTIVHVHRIKIYRGGESLSPKQEDARALEMARRLGHQEPRLKVLRVETFDRLLQQRVDVKAMCLVEIQPARPRSTAKRGKSAGGRVRSRAKARPESPPKSGARRSRN